MRHLRLHGILDDFEPYISNNDTISTDIYFIANENTIDKFKITNTNSGSISMYNIYIDTDNVYELDNRKKELAELCNQTYFGYNLYEERISELSQKAVTKIVAYTLVGLVSLISVFNIFNTIAQSIMLRKREFAELKSIGMSNKQLNKMLFLEGIFYGLDSVIYGILISLVILYAIYLIMIDTKLYVFSIPCKYIGISIFVTYLVIFIAIYSAKRKIRDNNIIDEIRDENI